MHDSKRSTPSKNPEESYRRRYVADYTGLGRKEIVYGEVKNHFGKTDRYSFDFLHAPNYLEQTTQHPVVILLHGGGFIQPCDKRQAYIPLLARSLVQEGWAVIAPDYPVFDTWEQLEKAGGETAGTANIRRAVEVVLSFLASHQQEFRIDLNRIALMGGSAGAMGALYTAVSMHGRFRAVVNLWGGMGSISDEIAQLPPVLTVHGTADDMVAYAREPKLHQALTEYSIQNRLIALEGAGHTPLGHLSEFMPVAISFLKDFL